MSGTIFNFGPYRFDCARGELRKHGLRVKLQPKSREVLNALLSRPGETVSRELLHQKLWAQGTYVDFDQGLNVAVKKLRDALCDDAGEPRYIETLSGIGYRFVADVTVDGLPPFAASPVVFPQMAGDAGALPRPAANSWADRWRWAMGALAVCVLLLITLAAMRRPGIGFTSDDWVLVSSFDNRTGDGSLDGVLQAALERELNNSRFVHVVPRERIYDVLTLMRLPGDTPLTASLGQEVCVRDGGVKLLLAGRVDKLGTKYVLGVNVVDPRSGSTLRSISREARSADDILRATHAVGNELRAVLGEEVAQIQLTDHQMEKVTTPSLEALRLFSVAYEYQIRNDFPSSIGYLQQAVKVDPQFATAWVHLAHAQRNTGEQGAAMISVQRAFDLADHVSERERLFILHSYYGFHGDREKELQYGEMLVRLYPDHYWGASNVANILWQMHRYQEAAALERQVLRLRPQVSQAINAAVRLGADDPALYAEFERMAHEIEARTGDPDGRAQLADMRIYDQMTRGDFRAAYAEIESLQPSTPNGNYTKAKWLLIAGRLREGERFAAEAPSNNNIALFTAFLRGGVKGLRGFVRSWPAPSYQTRSDSLLLYVLGVPAQRRASIFRRAKDTFPATFFPMWREAAEGELEFLDGGVGSSIRKIESALRRNDKLDLVMAPTATLLIADSLAGAYERSGRRRQAISVLEKYTDVAAWDPAVTWPMAARHLAELYRAAGDTSKAEVLEKKLAVLLEHADPDYSLDAQRGVTRAGIIAVARR